MSASSRTNSNLPALPSQLLEAQDLAIQTLGRLARFWGFTDSWGRVFGLLYLSPSPLTREAIQQRLGISAGSASMLLQDLQRWGVVQRTWIRGERRDHFRAETDFWRMITNVLDHRERGEIRAATESVKQALTLAERARRGTRGKAREPIDFVIERIRRLHVLYQLGQKLLDLLLSTRRLDITQHLPLFSADR